MSVTIKSASKHLNLRFDQVCLALALGLGFNKPYAHLACPVHLVY